MHFRNNTLRIFWHHPKKEPCYEDRLDGRDEHGRRRLLRADCIEKWIPHTNCFQRQKQRCICRSGSPGSHINGNCNRIFDSSLNASWCYETGTG